MGKLNSKEKNLGKPITKKKVRIIKRILLAFEILFALIIITAGIIIFVPGAKEGLVKAMASSSVGRTVIGWFGKGSYEEIQDSTFDPEEIIVNDNVKKDKDKLEKYTQILVVGIDSRAGWQESDTHSDSMIIVTINNETDEVSMVSVYRDTLMLMVDDKGVIQEGNYNKANQAYFNWGIKGTINTLNTNMDLHITDYAILDFNGVSKIIDAMGGIEVNLTQGEVYQLNFHLVDTKLATGLYTPNVTTPGIKHLTGLQATTYCRIRKTTYFDEVTNEEIRDDYGRAARQRLVIMKLIKSAKTMGLSKTLDVAKVIFSQNKGNDRFLKISFTWDEIVTLLSVAFDFEIGDTNGYPEQVSGGSYYIPSISSRQASIVVAKGTTYNVRKLHEAIYEGAAYTPSSRVTSIDSEIKALTGVEDYIDPVAGPQSSSNQIIQ